jgi:hypothetical protein
MDWRKLLQRIALSRDEDSEPQAERNDLGVRFDWERGFVRRGHSSHNDKVRRSPRWTGQIQAGRGGRLMELGVHACEWSTLPWR